MKTNRWGIAVAGIFIQMALGAVYAWSVFRDPLASKFGWSIPQITLTFTISIFVLGISAFFGGLWQNKQGPRLVAMTGGLLYGLGVFLASFADHGLYFLYVTYGVVGGIGVGLAYIVPVAVLVKWFPDKRGLITGIAVGGFGAGALITAPVAVRLISHVGVLHTFAILGVAFAVITVIGGYFMQNPPAGYQPAGWTPSASQKSQRASHEFTLGEALHRWQWWALWGLLFLNTSAGITVISQESSLFKEIAGASAATAATLVGIASMGNAAGRVFWAWVSDLITRKATFFVMFVAQIALFWFLPTVSAAAVMTTLIFLILLCYGGGFGTMPAFAADYFGSKNVGPIYGLMLTAWSLASVFGPLLMAHLRQLTGAYGSSLHIVAGVLVLAAILPLIVRPPRNATPSPAAATPLPPATAS